MWEGSVEGIYITPREKGAMQRVDEVNAVAGKGLEGDRYFDGRGTFSKKKGPDREITFVEAEAIEAANAAYDLALDLGDTRRNIVTRGVALNHLIGREFRVGGTRVRGLRLCEPCGYLEGLTQPGVRKALIHRGGLRAQILEDGVIRVGDVIKE